jgi:hypothetical protein
MAAKAAIHAFVAHNTCHAKLLQRGKAFSSKSGS